MTNYKKYKSELEKFAKLNVRFALDKETRNIVCCAGLQCSQCEFYENRVGHICDNAKLKWADDEYIELEEKEIDWLEVPVDTPILVRNSTGAFWKKRHFAEYENGGVYAWNDGMTSYTANKTTFWSYAKLAEVE